MSKKTQIAKIILSMTYAELVAVANDLIDMQTGAEDDGWKWRTDKLHGKFGLTQMLHSWAEGFESE